MAYYRTIQNNDGFLQLWLNVSELPFFDTPTSTNEYTNKCKLIFFVIKIKLIELSILNIIITTDAKVGMKIDSITLKTAWKIIGLDFPFWDFLAREFKENFI